MRGARGPARALALVLGQRMLDTAPRQFLVGTLALGPTAPFRRGRGRLRRRGRLGLKAQGRQIDQAELIWIQLLRGSTEQFSRQLVELGLQGFLPPLALAQLLEKLADQRLEQRRVVGECRGFSHRLGGENLSSRGDLSKVFRPRFDAISAADERRGDRSLPATTRAPPPRPRHSPRRPRESETRPSRDACTKGRTPNDPRTGSSRDRGDG